MAIYALAVRAIASRQAPAAFRASSRDVAGQIVFTLGTGVEVRALPSWTDEGLTATAAFAAVEIERECIAQDYYEHDVQRDQQQLDNGERLSPPVPDDRVVRVELAERAFHR